MIVSTNNVANVTPNSAVFIGDVEDLGNGIIQHGHCWSITPNPTLKNYSVQLGNANKVGEFKTIVNHLIPDTKYYIRSYVSKGELIKYGNEISFVTSPPQLATITNGKVRNITKTSAEVISQIEDIGVGCDTVFRYGHCWSLSKEPTIYDSIHEFKDCIDTTSIKSQFTNLNPGTKYYAKPFALNEAGLTYGEEISFTTLIAALATVNTGQVQEITQKSAKVSGSITDLGFESNGIQQFGHCWSLNVDPTVNDSVTEFGTSVKLREFSSSLSNLKPGITYHVRGYAINEAGIVYGDVKSFTTSEFGLVTLNTGSVRDITTNSALIIGHISNLGNGNDTITKYGHCWRIDGEPTILDSTTNYGIKTTTGDFSSAIENLIPGGQYFVKAYAISKAGISFGEAVSISATPELPIITTLAPVNITYNSAHSGGTIVYNGGIEILESGLCWSETSSPTIINNKIFDGTGSGTFQRELKNLLPGTTYYLRAYATNAAGTAYGDEYSITTISPKVPEITTIPVSGNIYAEALSGGNITDGGGYAITAKGLCWSTSPNPTISNYITTELSGTNYFTSTAINLKCDSTYYLRAYATNAMGTTYGEEIEFTSTRLFDYDGNSYKWVQIGKQIWMAENLKTTHYSDGVSIADGTGLTVSIDIDDRYWFVANNDITYKDTYGLYYTWYTVMRGWKMMDKYDNLSGMQGVCQKGWHVPSMDEFSILINELGGQEEAGKKLKSTNVLHWDSPLSTTNSSGFSAIGSGLRNKTWGNTIGKYAVFLTSDYENAYSIGMVIIGDDSESDNMTYVAAKQNSASVRCIKD